MRNWSVKVKGLLAETIIIRRGMPRPVRTMYHTRIKHCCARKRYEWVVVNRQGQVMDSGTCASRGQAEREAAESLAALS